MFPGRSTERSSAIRWSFSCQISRIQAWNRAQEEIYKLPRGEAIGRRLSEVFPLHVVRRIESERGKRADSEEAKAEAWDRILDVYTDEVFSIGIVCCTRQPIVVSDKLMNVPEEGIYSWDPGAHFGIYLPDTFYFSDTSG